MAKPTALPSMEIRKEIIVPVRFLIANGFAGYRRIV
jgi:hypothetical protein